MTYGVRNPPVTVAAARLAAGTVRMARDGGGIKLDYSPVSLTLVDRIIDGIRRGQPPARSVRGTLLGFGAYTGEVLVRAGRATWVDFDPGQRDIFGQPFGIRTPDGRVWNPLGKALKRYENGPADSLRLFYFAAAGRAQA